MWVSRVLIDIVGRWTYRVWPSRWSSRLHWVFTEMGRLFDICTTCTTFHFRADVTYTAAMKRTVERHKNIPANLMEDYVKWRITSVELAEKTGYHAVYIRRSIKRDDRPEPQTPKNDESHRKLLEARENLRKKLAHLPSAEIAKRAHVSLSTAARIKKRYMEKT